MARYADPVVIRQLANALKEAQACIMDVSVRLDVNTVGEAKWTLMRCADTLRGTLHRSGADGT